MKKPDMEDHSDYYQQQLEEQQQMEEEHMSESKEKDFFKEDKEETEVEISPGFFSLSPAHSKIFTALSKAQGEIETAKKSKENPHWGSKYADIHDVGQAIKEPLANNGLFYTQMWMKGESKTEIVIRTMIGHSSGEYMTYVSSIWVKVPEDIQSVGKCLTYARRYILSSAFGVTATERGADDDGNEASLPQESDPVLLKKLDDEHKKGVQAVQAVWKKFTREERLKVAPKDRDIVKAKAQKYSPQVAVKKISLAEAILEEKHNATGKPRVASSPSASTNGE